MNNQSIDTRSSFPVSTQFPENRSSIHENTQRFGVSESFDDIFSSYRTDDDFSSETSDDSSFVEDDHAVLNDSEQTSVSENSNEDQQQDDDHSDTEEAEVDDERITKDASSSVVRQEGGESNKKVDGVEKSKAQGVASSSKDKAQLEETPKLISTLALKVKTPKKVVAADEAKKNVTADAKLASQPKEVKTSKPATVQVEAKVKTQAASSGEKIKPGSEIKIAANEIKDSDKNTKPAVANLKNTIAEAQTDKKGQAALGLSKNSNVQTNLGKTSEVKETKVEGEQNLQGKALAGAKKQSVKTSRVTVAQQNSYESQSLRSPENTGIGGASFETSKSESEIGIKSALQTGVTKKNMLNKDKSADDKAADKVFLKDSVDVNHNRPQSVASRSDLGGSMNHSQSGSQDQGSANREFARQWMVDSAENRSTAQAAQKTQLVDKTVSSQLSTHVLNQIVNHIEKMRESDRNRVKVSLGGGDKGNISVDIRIEDGVVYTSFEGDEDILDELKRDWTDLSDRASQKGVVLEDPEFISYSSSVENEPSFPGTDTEIEEESQSVIQHNDNKPVRPVLQTATSGSSGPVHSYA